MIAERHKSFIYKRWVKISVILVGSILVLFFTLWFFVSTDFCGRNIILPIVSDKTGVKISASKASISPSILSLSRIRVSDLQLSLGDKTETELIFIESGEVYFSLRQLINGRIFIDSGKLTKPVFNIKINVRLGECISDIFSINRITICNINFQ